jgi:hypothetical protein
LAAQIVHDEFIFWIKVVLSVLFSLPTHFERGLRHNGGNPHCSFTPFLVADMCLVSFWQVWLHRLQNELASRRWVADALNRTNRRSSVASLTPTNPLSPSRYRCIVDCDSFDLPSLFVLAQLEFFPPLSRFCRSSFALPFRPHFAHRFRVKGGNPYCSFTPFLVADMCLVSFW